jgi:hypothetical protein
MLLVSAMLRLTCHATCTCTSVSVVDPLSCTCCVCFAVNFKSCLAEGDDEQPQEPEPPSNDNSDQVSLGALKH